MEAGGQKASVARSWNEADAGGTEWSLHPVFVLGSGGGNRAGEMESARGSAQWNEPGYSSRTVQPGLRAERADLSDRSREVRTGKRE